MNKDISVQKADVLAHKVYAVTREFPKDELFGVISQLRRAVLSIVLNIIEGYARTGTKEYIHFLETAYASLKEVKYLLFFSYKEKYYDKDRYQELIVKADELGKILWVKIQRLKQKARN